MRGPNRAYGLAAWSGGVALAYGRQIDLFALEPGSASRLRLTRTVLASWGLGNITFGTTTSRRGTTPPLLVVAHRRTDFTWAVSVLDVLDVTTGNVLDSREFECVESPTVAAWGADASRVALAALDEYGWSVVRVFTRTQSSNPLVQEWRWSSPPCWSIRVVGRTGVRFSADGHALALTEYDGSVTTHRALDGEVLAEVVPSKLEWDLMEELASDGANAFSDQHGETSPLTALPVAGGTGRDRHSSSQWNSYNLLSIARGVRHVGKP